MDSDGADYEGARIADRGTGAGAATGGCRKGGRLWLYEGMDGLRLTSL